MSTSAVTNAGEPERLLAATRQLIGTVRYCWAMTAAEGGGVNARLMGRLPSLAGDDEWTVWFLTRDSSRKAAEIRCAGRLTVGYQHDVDGAYAVLSGPAALVEDLPGLRRRWQDSWKVHFRGPDDPDAVLVRMEVDRIELCMRGVTPEPFGSRYLALQRGSTRPWEVVAA
ncbi:MAG TPA: pyridoxamine 5'-phosphate oxidase family protein [Stellaceae bacterium]|nr:pyridoxamine 5'-phosphate oxidase family protein [Stellaceae bacterium]